MDEALFAGTFPRCLSSTMMTRCLLSFIIVGWSYESHKLLCSSKSTVDQDKVMVYMAIAKMFLGHEDGVEADIAKHGGSCAQQPRCPASFAHSHRSSSFLVYTRG